MFTIVNRWNQLARPLDVRRSVELMSSIILVPYHSDMPSEQLVTMGTSVLCYSFLSPCRRLLENTVLWNDVRLKKGSLPFFFIPPLKISPMITSNRNKKKRFHRSTECPCYRAKSLELLNSRLRLYFRIDKASERGREREKDGCWFKSSLFIPRGQQNAKGAKEKEREAERGRRGEEWRAYFSVVFFFFIPIVDIS